MEVVIVVKIALLFIKCSVYRFSSIAQPKIYFMSEYSIELLKEISSKLDALAITDAHIEHAVMVVKSKSDNFKEERNQERARINTFKMKYMLYKKEKNLPLSEYETNELEEYTRYRDFYNSLSEEDKALADKVYLMNEINF